MEDVLGYGSLTFEFSFLDKARRKMGKSQVGTCRCGQSIVLTVSQMERITERITFGLSPSMSWYHVLVVLPNAIPFRPETFF